VYLKENFEDARDLESHYNERQNRCFANTVLVTRMADNGLKVGFQLTDVNENRILASFQGRGTGSANDLVDYCSVNPQKCASGKEWVALVKPYMEQ
jgi:hypothetical protein